MSRTPTLASLARVDLSWVSDSAEQEVWFPADQSERNVPPGQSKESLAHLLVIQHFSGFQPTSLKIPQYKSNTLNTMHSLSIKYNIRNTVDGNKCQLICGESLENCSLTVLTSP